MPGLTKASARFLIEAAAVCLEEKKHKAGAILYIEGISNDKILLEWDDVDEQQRNSYNDLHESTEFGACGIAILILKNITGKVVLQRSYKGSGFDYWVGEENAVETKNLFSGKYKLEVSGILEGDKNKINSRIKQKKEQINKFNKEGAGFVAVTEFSSPIIHLEGV